MKFVSPYHPVEDRPVTSAWGRTLFTLPSVHYLKQLDMWMNFNLVILMHCSQNDEFMIFPMMVNMVSMFHTSTQLSWEAEDPYWNEHSRFIVDFGDCDYHHFSQRDMKLGVLFFSDALRSYTQDFLGKNAFSSRKASEFMLCFMTHYGFQPIFANGGLAAAAACNLEFYGKTVTFYFDPDATFSNMYTPEEWGLAMSHTNAQADEDAVHDMEEKAHVDLVAHASNCNVNVGADLKRQVDAVEGEWWLDDVNPLAHPSTRGAICSTADFYTFDAGDTSIISGLEDLAIPQSFKENMDAKDPMEDYYSGY